MEQISKCVIGSQAYAENVIWIQVLAIGDALDLYSGSSQFEFRSGTDYPEAFLGFP
jgi:hypothetical protein